MSTTISKESIKLAPSFEEQINIDFTANYDVKGVSGSGLTIHNIPCDDWWLVRIYEFSSAKRLSGLSIRSNLVREGNKYRPEIYLDAVFRFPDEVKDCISRIYIFFENEDSDGTTLSHVPISPPAGWLLNEEELPIVSSPIQILEGNMYRTKVLTAVGVTFYRVP